MSTERFALRPYQHEAIEAVDEARRRGLRRALICLPTGAGKTVIFSELARRATGDVIVLAHREELLEQARDKLERALQGSAKVAIEQGNRRAPADARVIVCSIRSLHEGRIGQVLQGRRIELVIYDECHHAAADDNKRVLRQIGVFEPDWPGILVGFTATTRRGDGIGLDTVFEDIVCERTMADLIEGGYLVPLRGYRIATQADLHQVSGVGGDFNLEELAEAVDIQERNALVARSIQELARDRRALVFCVTVAHAKHLARALNRIGVPTGIVYGEMPSDRRQEVLANFRDNTLMALTNVGVLTEGFDDPEVSCVAMARPTRSSGLYAQCVGRGTRLFEGKRDCLVLDFVDLSDVSLVTLPSLFGMPRQLNMLGEEVEEVRRQLQGVWFDFDEFDQQADEVTIHEIKRRAQSFDPLTLDVDPEVLAISPLAWESLGRAGLALHLMRRPGKLRECLILDTQKRGKGRYRVVVDGEQEATFSTIEAAIEACDYEVGQLGPQAWESAQPHAPWRLGPIPEPLQARLERLPRWARARPARNHGEALRQLAYGAHASRPGLPKRGE